MILYFGKKATTVLREQGTLKIYADKCHQPMKLAEGIERLWTKDKNGIYHWEELDDKIPLCGNILFYQYEGDDIIYCTICEEYGMKENPKKVIAWYQTTPRNMDVSQSYRFTHAEKLAMNSMTQQ